MAKNKQMMIFLAQVLFIPMVGFALSAPGLKGVTTAAEGSGPAIHVQQPDPSSLFGGEVIEITDPQGRKVVIREKGYNNKEFIQIKGKVIMTRGDDVTIQLEEKDQRVTAGDRVELSFSVDGEVIPVGTWRVSKVKEDGTLEAEMFNKNSPPGIAMDALVFLQGEALINREKQQRGEPVEKASLGHEETRLERACQGGDAHACADLANRYFHGTGSAIDYSRATRFSTMACDGGSALGCNLLGVIYATGKGVAVDTARAIGLYRKACDGGFALGCSNLGFFYRDGIGVDQDFARAIELYRMACDGGDADGCSDLGFMYGTGLGVELAYTSAVALYRRACDAGGAMGCKNLGGMYEYGLGVDQDYQLAVLYYEKGCDGGEALGCASLGRMLYSGRGVAVNQAKGRALIDKACTMGNLGSCEKLKELGNPK